MVPTLGEGKRKGAMEDVAGGESFARDDRNRVDAFKPPGFVEPEDAFGSERNRDEGRVLRRAPQPLLRVVDPEHSCEPGPRKDGVRSRAHDIDRLARPGDIRVEDRGEADLARGV